MFFWKKTGDTEIRNIVMLALTVLVESLQILIILVTIFHFIPLKLSPFVYTLFPKHQAGVLPEREMFFYRFFVFTNLILQAGLLYIFRKRLKDTLLTPALGRWVLVLGLGILVQLFAVFKILIYGKPLWAMILFYVSLAVSISIRIFWPEVNRWAGIFRRAVLQQNILWSYRRWIDTAVVVLIGVLIWVPDIHKILARIFANDRLYHVDGFIMAPAWAYTSGVVLGQDVISQYSVVLPKMIAWFSGILGGLSYASVIQSLMMLTILYYVLFYVLARKLFGRTSVAVFVVCIGIKLQMFHYGVFPLIWQFLTPLVVRYMFDVMFLMCVLQHLRTNRRVFLWMSSCLAGLAMGYMTDTGVYLLLAFYSYMFFTLILPVYRKALFIFPKDLSRALGLAVLPWLTAFAVLFIFNGPMIFQSAFWVNQSEHIRLFLQGWGALPMYDGLRERQFFAFVMGFVIPAVYLSTLLFVGSVCALTKEKRDDLIFAVIAVYGLAMYHYFIYRSAVTSYYVVGLPFVLIIGYWLHQLTLLLPDVRRRIVMLAVVILALGGLLTNRFYLIYPNALNSWRLDWAKEEEFYQANKSFDKDAALIQSYSQDDTKVPLISSFEVSMLMQAKRKPFFYYFPLLESSHMQSNRFRGTYLHTQERMNKTLRQLDTEKPEYVFVETKLLKGQINPDYYKHYQTLTTLIQYALKNYEIKEDGQYLTVLKRKP